MRKHIFKPFNKPFKMMKNTNDFITESLCLPKDLVHGDSVISLTGNEEAWIENYKGIVEYEPEKVCLQLKKGKVLFLGNQLHISFYTSEEMKITGEICEIKYYS